MMIPKIISHAATVVSQNKKDRVSGRGARSKRKRHFPPAFWAALPTCLLHVCRSDGWQRKLIVFKVLLQTFEKTIRLLLGNWNVLFKGKEFELIIGFLPTDVVLESQICMASESVFIQVLIQVCLLKRMWEISQASSCQIVCSIGFQWEHGLVCWSSK